MKKIVLMLFVILLVSLFISCDPTGNDSGDGGNEEYTLTITIEPDSSGTVSPANGSYPANDEVELTATANQGYVFSEWTGDISTIENPYTITMNSDKNITAVFVTESDGTSWTELTSSASWTGRSSHTSVVYDDKIWIMGGTINQGGTIVNVNDVWWSEDGINWTEATSNANWGVRTSHASLVYDGKMWVFAGLETTSEYWGDVWWSEDGINWTEASNNNWGEDRKGHTAVVFDDKMLIIGGAGFSAFQEIWSSTDGISWTQEADGAWSGRMHHASSVYDNEIWVIGGQTAYGTFYTDDVWTSDNLTVWTEKTLLTLNDEYYGHTSIVYSNKLWLLGGNGNQKGVWYYETGDTGWTQANSDAFPERAYHTSVSFKGKMYVIGGSYASLSGIDYRNDVYISD